MNARERLIAKELMGNSPVEGRAVQIFASALYQDEYNRWSLKRKRGIYHKPPEIVGRWPSRKRTPKERKRQWLSGKVMSEAEQIRLYNMIYEQVIGEGFDDDAQVRQGQ